MDLQKKIQACLKDGKSRKSKEIAQEIGVDSKEISKALKEMKKQGTVIVPKNCYYSVPKK